MPGPPQEGQLTCAFFLIMHHQVKMERDIRFQGLTDTDWLKLEAVQMSENRFETSCSA